MSMGKKTISPADVFKALDDVEFGFLKERLEAEYNSTLLILTQRLYHTVSLAYITNNGDIITILTNPI